MQNMLFPAKIIPETLSASALCARETLISPHYNQTKTTFSRNSKSFKKFFMCGEKQYRNSYIQNPKVTFLMLSQQIARSKMPDLCERGSTTKFHD